MRYAYFAPYSYERHNDLVAECQADPCARSHHALHVVCLFSPEDALYHDVIFADSLASWILRGAMGHSDHAGVAGAGARHCEALPLSILCVHAQW